MITCHQRPNWIGRSGSLVTLQRHSSVHPMVKIPLEGDGCVANLYHFLWSKNADGRSCPGVYIPDTVVYKYRQPAYWYFTSKEAEGQLKMKNKINLGNSKVEESFCARRAPQSSDVICYYIATQGADENTTVEHFDVESLREFLYFRNKENNGILQRFVLAKGEYNTIIRCVWSPNIFLGERRSNVIPVEDRKVSLHKRCVTYEGEEFLTQTVAITDTLLGRQLERLCRGIVSHVAAISENQMQIARMVLHFKVDKNDKIWLLWCSSMRLAREVVPTSVVEAPSPLNLSHSFGVPSHVRRFLTTTKNVIKPANEKRKSFSCPSCLRRVAPEERCECTYKMAIDFAGRHAAVEEALQEQQGGASSQKEEIPAMLARLHPNLTLENYKLLCKDPLFQYSRMAVCEVCFLELTQSIAELTEMQKVNPGPASSLGEKRAATAATTSPSRSTSASGALSRASTSMAFRRDVKPSASSPPEPPRARSRASEFRSSTSAWGTRSSASDIPMVNRSRSRSPTSSIGLARPRATRLAEQYVASVSSSSLLREFGAKNVGRLPNPLAIRMGATSAPPDVAGEEQQGLFTPEADVAAAVDSFVDPGTRTLALSVVESEHAFMEQMKKRGLPSEVTGLVNMRQVADVLQKLDPQAVNALRPLPTTKSSPHASSKGRQVPQTHHGSRATAQHTPQRATTAGGKAATHANRKPRGGEGTRIASDNWAGGLDDSGGEEEGVTAAELMAEVEEGPGEAVEHQAAQSHVPEQRPNTSKPFKLGSKPFGRGSGMDETADTAETAQDRHSLPGTTNSTPALAPVRTAPSGTAKSPKGLPSRPEATAKDGPKPKDKPTANARPHQAKRRKPAPVPKRARSPTASRPRRKTTPAARSRSPTRASAASPPRRKGKEAEGEDTRPFAGDLDAADLRVAPPRPEHVPKLQFNIRRAVKPPPDSVDPQLTLTTN